MTDTRTIAGGRNFDRDLSLLPHRTDRVALAVLVLLAVLLPLFASEYWLKGILIPMLIFGLATLGLNFVTGYAGMISLGQAAFMALGAFGGVVAYGEYGIPIPLSLFLAGALAAAVGAVVGTPSLRIKGLYLLVATLAAQFIIIWGIQRVPWIGTGAFVTINTPPVHVGSWNVESSVDQYYLTLIVVGLLTLFGWNLARSRIGRAWMAIRDHDVAAAAMGVSMLRYKLLAFMVSSFYAGVAGALVVFCWVGAAHVQDYELSVSIEILGMVIIGGMGSILGSFLGAAFVMLLPILINSGMHEVYGLIGRSIVSADVLANLEHVVFGVLILVFLIKEPLGLARLWWNLTGKPRSRQAGQGTEPGNS